MSLLFHHVWSMLKTQCLGLRFNSSFFVFQSASNASDIISLGTSLHALVILYENHFFLQKEKKILYRECSQNLKAQRKFLITSNLTVQLNPSLNKVISYIFNLALPLGILAGLYYKFWTHKTSRVLLFSFSAATQFKTRWALIGA